MGQERAACLDGVCLRTIPNADPLSQPDDAIGDADPVARRVLAERDRMMLFVEQVIGTARRGPHGRTSKRARAQEIGELVAIDSRILHRHISYGILVMVYQLGPISYGILVMAS